MNSVWAGASVSVQTSLNENSVIDVNRNEINCTELSDPATDQKRKQAWEGLVADNGGIHRNCGMARRGCLIAVLDEGDRAAKRGFRIHANRHLRMPLRFRGRPLD